MPEFNHRRLAECAFELQIANLIDEMHDRDCDPIADIISYRANELLRIMTELHNALDDHALTQFFDDSLDFESAAFELSLDPDDCCRIPIEMLDSLYSYSPDE